MRTYRILVNSYYVVCILLTVAIYAHPCVYLYRTNNDEERWLVHTACDLIVSSIDV